jgi:hypothetical protein
MVRFAKVFNGSALEPACFSTGAASLRNLGRTRDFGRDWPAGG